MRNALEGVTVIAVEQAVAAPMRLRGLRMPVRGLSRSSAPTVISHDIMTIWSGTRVPISCG